MHNGSKNIKSSQVNTETKQVEPVTKLRTISPLYWLSPVLTKTLYDCWNLPLSSLQGSQLIFSPLFLSPGLHQAFHLRSEQLQQWELLLPDNDEKQHQRCAQSNRDGEASYLLSYTGIKDVFIPFIHKGMYLFNLFLCICCMFYLLLSVFSSYFTLPCLTLCHIRG